MPEQVQTPFFDQRPSGISHDRSDPFPMSGSIAVYLTVLAERLVFQGASQATLNRVLQKITTVGAAVIFCQRVQFCRQTIQAIPLGTMMIAAVQGRKHRQDSKIFFFFACQGLGCTDSRLHSVKDKSSRPENP